MAQDLIKISLEKFVLQLPIISDRALINLYEALCQWLRNEGKKIGTILPETVLLDILRKQAKIEKELYSRGLIQKFGPRADEFNAWYRKVHTQLKRREF